MRKKVVREEPLGHARAVKVIYDDGSWGIKGIPDEKPESKGPGSAASTPPAPLPFTADVNMRVMMNSPQFRAAEEMTDPGEPGQITDDRYAKLLAHYISRAGKDLDTEDPEAFRALGATLNDFPDTNDPKDTEEVYQEWVRAMKDETPGASDRFVEKMNRRYQDE